MQPVQQERAAAEAIALAEEKLAGQNSVTAMVDLQVVSAVMNAHLNSTRGRDALNSLQRQIDAALRARTDLDTPAGARDFQRFLIGKLREIGAVIETAHLDSTSRAALVAAWATLYGASSDSEAHSVSPQPDPDSAPPPNRPSTETLQNRDGSESAEPPTAPSAPTPTQVGQAPPHSSAMPGPAQLPVPGFPAGPPLSDPSGRAAAGLSRLGTGTENRPLNEKEPLIELSDDDSPDTDEAGASDSEAPEAAAGNTFLLPTGETVTAPSPQVAAAVRAAIGGLPIAEAFRQQGMAIPAPGTPLAEPLPPERVGPGDVGVFVNDHALALGSQKALINGQIEPMANAAGPDFLGWVHPPAPVNLQLPTQAPAQTRPASLSTVAV